MGLNGAHALQMSEGGTVPVAPDFTVDICNAGFICLLLEIDDNC